MKEIIMKKTTIATSVLVLLSVLLSACNLQAASPTQMGPDQINTIAAATVQALTTQMAPPPATATPLPTIAPTATATLAVPTLNLTVIPTLSLATSTLIPLPTTAGSTECNKVFFISDETIPDGTVFTPGKKNIEKTWKIKNDGTCTWTTLYSAAAFSNDPTDPVITGQGSVLMKTNVAPGAIVTISVSLTAPDKEGTYTQYWKMYDADGKPFGIGGPAGAGWYVQIKVSKTGAVTGKMSTAATVSACADGEVTLDGSIKLDNGVATLPYTAKYFYQIDDRQVGEVNSVIFNTYGSLATSSFLVTGVGSGTHTAKVYITGGSIVAFMGETSFTCP